ncbi:MAG: alkaline phosphatase D family protein [Fimbriiglobus sp.]
MRMLWLWSVVALVVGSVSLRADTDTTKVLTKIAFGSCADQDKDLPVFDTIAATKPDLYITLGDNIYADLDKSRKVTGEVIKEKYDKLASLEGWKKIKAACPILATWDDHDFGKNDGGAEFEVKDESQKLFHDFFGTPTDSPRRARKGVYDARIFGPEGKRVQVIMLDTRYFRAGLKVGPAKFIEPYGRISKPYVPSDEKDAMFLGEEQWTWLADELKKPADLRLLCSSIQVISEDHPFEKWANIPAERNRLYTILRDSGATGVVILSGDRHLGELSVDKKPLNYPLYDITASGLNQGFDRWRDQEPNRFRVSSMPFGDHFGMILIDWSDKPSVSLQLRDVAGEIVLKQTFPISVLAPRQDKKGEPKKDEPKKEEPKEDEKLPEGVLTPAEAAKKVGETVTVQYTVKGGRAVNEGKRVLLNSDKDFKAKENFTVVLNAKGMTGKWDKATYDTFKDKVIRAKGKVTLFKDSPQIQIDEEASLEIIEKK